MKDENIILKTSPSQILNIGTYLFWGLMTIISFFIPLSETFRFIPLTVGLVGILVCLWKFLVLKNQVYILSNERLKVESGVFSKHLEEIELYRVKDSTLEKPFTLRIFGLGNIGLVTSDVTAPNLIIPAIANADMVKEKLRDLVEHSRRNRNVREIDMN